MLEASLDAIVAMDREGLVASWNPAAEALFGWRETEAMGRPLEELIIPPGSREAHRRGLERLLQTQRPRLLGRRVEVTAQRRDGRPVDIELTLSQLGALAEEPLFVAHLRDISERRDTQREWESRNSGLARSVEEQTLRLAQVSARLEVSEARRARSEELLRSAFRSSPVSLTVVTLDTGRLVEANDTFLDWVGRRREDVLGRTTQELQLWAEPEAREAFLRDIARDGFVRNRECRFQLRGGGGVSTMLVSAERIEFDGAPHVFAASLSIDAQKQAETELRRALEQEQELRRLKSSFVSMVSHEYRTPLGVIQSAAEILDTYFDRLAPARRRLHLADIRDATATMTRLMDEVLFLEKSESGRLAFRPAPLGLEGFLRELLATPGFAEQAARVKLECPDGLPVGWIDPSVLRLAVGNLVGNALKYSPAGSRVRVGLRRDEAWAVLSVSDQGIGIPEADRARLFEPFHRGRNVGDITGSGLGLVIVRKGAELHGGRVTVDSREGAGTTFELHLPVFREPDPA